MNDKPGKFNEKPHSQLDKTSKRNRFSFDLDSDIEDSCDDLDCVSIDTPTYARNGTNKSPNNRPGQPVPTSVPSELLLRLFESNFFNIGMAIQYLFESNKKGVLDYLKGRLISFPEPEVDFYLPQLITLWNLSAELKETLSPYLVSRCKKSLDFAINVSWLLQTFENKNSSTSQALSQSSTAIDFTAVDKDVEIHSEPRINHSKSVPQFNRFIPESMDQVQDDDEKYTDGVENDSAEIRELDKMSISSNQSILSSDNSVKIFDFDHGTCSSDISETRDGLSESTSSSDNRNKMKNDKCSVCCLKMSNFLLNTKSLIHLTPLTNDQEEMKKTDSTFDINSSSKRISLCQCECHNGVQVESFWQNSLIKNEFEFMNSLFVIGRHLTKYSSKEKRTSHLLAELALLNLKLPARVWLPVCKNSHIVLRIPPNSAVCLNSKDRAPFLVFVEVLECKNPQSVEIPSKSHLSSCATSISSLNDLDFMSRLPVALKRKHHNLITEHLTSNSQMFNNLKSCQMQCQPTPTQHCSGEDFNKLQSLSSALAIAAPDSVSVISTESSTDDLISYYHDQLQNITSQLNNHHHNLHHSTVANFTCHDISMMNSNTSINNSCNNTNDKQKNNFIYERPAFISASDVRKKLTKYQNHNNSQRKAFKADPEDPSAEVLKEPWSVKCLRIQEKSPWGHLPNWRLISAIVKVGDDLRQEQLAYQLLRKLQSIWNEEGVDLWLRPLEIIVFGSESGLIEPVPDTVSFHQIRRHAKISLLDYMIKEHGSMNSRNFIDARKNFIRSCAAYCLVGYLFQVKDRHNGNILLDNEGHLIHIDYGFMLSSSPGKNFGFESSPFKLTHEQVQVMGGINSDSFESYKKLILHGLLAARKHMDDICLMVEIQRKGYPKLPCFARGKNTVEALRNRFLITKTSDYITNFVGQMVEASLHSITTKLYDSFQYYTNGIQ